MLLDVKNILGLPVEGDAVVEQSDVASLKVHFQNFWGVGADKIAAKPTSIWDNGTMSCQAICDRCLAQKGDTDIQVQGFLLLVLGSTIFVDKSGSRFPPSCILEVKKKDVQLSHYSWSSATLTYLYRQLGVTSWIGCRQIAGCLTLLQSWIYEEQIAIQQDKGGFIILEGSDRTTTIITSDVHSPALNSITFALYIDNFVARGVTFKDIKIHYGMIMVVIISSLATLKEPLILYGVMVNLYMRLAVYTYYTMSLESFWKRAGKSQKSSTCSSPSSRDPPIEEHVSPNDDEVPIAATIPPPENTGPSVPNTTVDSDDTRIYDVDLLPHDPGKRIPIMEYPPNDRDAVRRGYITKKRCDPRTHNFPQRKVGGGFRGWNKTGRFDVHVGGIGSFHNQANEKYSMFINPKTSVAESLCTYSKEAKLQYKSRLTYSLKCIRFLLNQGLACRGHNESDESWNRGNFLALLTWFSENNSEVAKVVLGNALGNNRMTSPSIQKELINCCAKETTRLLIDDIGDDYFGIMAGESSDVSQKEQMALCLRYVNNKGKINERFLGIVHVKDTTALSLKSAIESLLMEYSLSLSRVRGQGYDGASNMRGEINGLKTLIMNETKQAYYIHCFAHQLQLTLVAVAKDNDDCIWLFDQLAILLNIIGVSCKRSEMIREIQSQHILQALELGEIESGQGLNQEHGLGRPGDTRWGSHYKTVSNVTAFYATIVKVLEKIGSNKIYKDDRVKAITVMSTFESFEFVFMIHLMSEIFGITDKLCQALQKGDQDIVNAMTYVKLTKEGLQQMRVHGWEDFLHLVVCFCVKHDVEVPTMDDMYVPHGRSRRFFAKVSNLHRFRVEMFISVIDLQLQELNSRFDE
ncbi:zinc finger MYM-type protein 1-like [Chenopodium quinoa]|uniref:zinc finger MYM-type protein 1-like n=1 Tax=Chenopodium quinoa TaxID=63459 RepID=UPI000B799A7F|nr:zinc finger MYM-type protein 1-like [Chenopodium quinoa]